MRLFAYGIDVCIATILVGIIRLPLSIASMSGVKFLKSPILFHYTCIDILGYIGVVAYFVLLTYYTHTTIGKRLFRLEIICEEEWTFVNVLYRETIGRFLSSILNVGYLAIIVQKEKQGFHDLLCDTHVIYKNMSENKKAQQASFVTFSDLKNSSDSVLGNPSSFESENHTLHEERYENNMVLSEEKTNLDEIPQSVVESDNMENLEN